MDACIQGRNPVYCEVRRQPDDHGFVYETMVNALLVYQGI